MGERGKKGEDGEEITHTLHPSIMHYFILVKALLVSNFYFTNEQNISCMSKKQKTLEKVLGGSKNISFSEFISLKVLWLETARSHGKPIPITQYQPALYELAGH